MTPLSAQLILWYKAHARNLPWRLTHDPFRIWVSEIILQQTQVKQGYDYYLRFLEAFPNVKSLYNASSDALMKQWQGLGYYSRARNMHIAAKQIMEDYEGVFPNTYEGLLSLRGVGPYTAAAIASFAYELPYAVLDGNVYRVLSRYFGIQLPINDKTAYKYYIAIAQEVMDDRQAALHNQAIMEFGALQCKVQSPNCQACILASSCVALAQQMVKQLPIKLKKIKIKERYLHFFYICHGDSFVIEKRKGKGIWQGLYQLPLVETSEDAPLEEATLRKSIGALVPPSASVYCITDMWHQLTHQKLHIRFYKCSLQKPLKKPPGERLICHHTDMHYAFPKPIVGFLEQIGGRWGV